jgi:uncharacterized protein (TIGR02147 family)
MNKIFQYIDYRIFLADYFLSMKKKHSFFSYRWFANKAEVSSSGLYQRLVKGDRNLTEKTTEKFLHAMELGTKEAEYFRVLVAFNQARSTKEKQRNYTLMVSMANLVEESPLELDQYGYLSDWYTPVIRELLPLIQVEDDYKSIAKTLKPSISEKNAQKSVELLLRMGFIQKSKNGSYQQCTPAISSGTHFQAVMTLARRAFNANMIKLAKEALERFPIEKRYAVGITLSISDSTYEVLLQEFHAFRERVVAIANKEKKPSKICQMNFQLFPLTQELMIHKEGEL